MNNEHPITPPRELVQQWLSEYYGAVSVAPGEATSHIATQAARWGADQELKACCGWLSDELAAYLRDRRRPKPSSLKAQALEAVQRFYANGHEDCTDEEMKDDFDIIRRALETLDD